MNSPFNLLLTIILSFFCLTNLHAQEYSSAINKDTISNYYRLMDVKILLDSNAQEVNQKISLTKRDGKATSIDVSLVYELSFYLIANNETELSIVLYSGDQSSETLVFNLPKSNGSYQKVIFPMALGGNVNPEKISSIQIKLTGKGASSNSRIQIDEFVFNYFETPLNLNGKPNFDNETLKKEYEEYIENNQSPKQNIEPTEDDTWSKGNKSVKAR